MAKNYEEFEDFDKGKIISRDEDDNVYSYDIEVINAEFEEDMPDIIGVYRCTGITISSDAPNAINSEAEDYLYNDLADEEFNDADRKGKYIKKAEKAISNKTGVDKSKIYIE